MLHVLTSRIYVADLGACCRNGVLRANSLACCSEWFLGDLESMGIQMSYLNHEMNMRMDTPTCQLSATQRSVSPTSSLTLFFYVLSISKHFVISTFLIIPEPTQLFQIGNTDLLGLSACLNLMACLFMAPSNDRSALKWDDPSFILPFERY